MDVQADKDPNRATKKPKTKHNCVTMSAPSPIHNLTEKMILAKNMRTDNSQRTSNSLRSHSLRAPKFEGDEIKRKVKEQSNY